MNKDIIQGNWKEAKGKIRQQWSDCRNDAEVKSNANSDIPL